MGFTYDTWKSLCVEDSGREAPYDLLFALRIIWIEWYNKGVTPTSTPKI
jgi:hypothetical protein